MKKYIVGIVSIVLIIGIGISIYFTSKSKKVEVNNETNSVSQVVQDNNAQQEATNTNKIHKITLAEGQKFSDVLKQFGVTEEKEIKSILLRGRPDKKQLDLDEEAQSGDTIRLSLSNGKIRKVIMKLKNGKKYVTSDKFSYSDEWKINNSSVKLIQDVYLVDKSRNLVGDTQYFLVYTGEDKSKKKLDTIVSSIMKLMKTKESFDLYDDFNAAKIDYIYWTSVIFSKKIGDRKELDDDLKYCYNYKLEHLLVSTDNYGNIIFSNYELNKEYQNNLRSGIYQKCNPEEFIDSYENHMQLLYFSEALNNELIRIIKEKEGKQCQELIRKKFRYVNSLSFDDKIDVNVEDNIIKISGTLVVEATSGYKAKQLYSCTYDRDKKEFIDWSVDDVQKERNF